MNIRHAVSVATGLAAVLAVAVPATLTAAGSPSFGSTTTVAAGVLATTVPPADDFVLPPGYSELTDDTNRITVAVPDAWADRDTIPADIDGALVPWINAATNLQVWNDSFDAPGVLFAAFPFAADPQSLLTRFGLTGGCQKNTTVAYEDGVFTGLWGQWTECGAGGAAEWHLIVASPANSAFTALVVMQLTGPQDQQAFDVVLETFNTTPAATWPTPGSPTTVPGGTLAATTTPAPPTVAPTSVAATTAGTTPVTASLPIATLPPTTPSTPSTPSTPATAPTATTIAVTVAPPPSTAPGTSAAATVPASTAVPATAATVPASTAPVAATQVVDETGLLTVTIPASWTDQDTGYGRHDDGSRRATITAAPSIEQYYTSWETPGVYFVGLPPSVEPAAFLQEFTYSNLCTDAGTVPYDDGRFVGLMQTWGSCGGGTARLVHVAARPIDSSFTAFLQVQLVDADDTILNQILGSFGLVPGATYPAPAVLAPLPTIGAVPPELLAPPAITMTPVSDEDGIVTFNVPSTWTDVDPESQLNDSGTSRAHIAVAPVIDDYFNTWETPGALVIAYPYTADPSSLLRNVGFGDVCSDGGARTFGNGTFTGLMQTWSECGDTDTRDVHFALSPADQSMTLFVEVQLPDADNTPLQAVLSSLQLN